MNIKNQIAKLAHLNVREEKHGEETVLALDIKLTADVPNTFLDVICQGLKASLYKRDDNQGDLLGDDQHMTSLRYPSMATIKFGLSMTSAKLVIEFFQGPHAESLDFEVTVKRIDLDCKEGGTVAISFNAQTLPDSGQVGTLSALLGHDVTVSLYPGAVSQLVAEQRDNSDDDDEC